MHLLLRATVPDDPGKHLGSEQEATGKKVGVLSFHYSRTCLEAPEGTHLIFLSLHQKVGRASMQALIESYTACASNERSCGSSPGKLSRPRPQLRAISMSVTNPVTKANSSIYKATAMFPAQRSP
jgi:hypothetical protein